MKQISVLTILIVWFSTAQADVTFTSISCLVGTWTSEGDAFGSPARSTMSWQTTLDAKFYRLDIRIKTYPEDREGFQFSGIAYYHNNEKSGFWADSSGDLLPIAALKDNTALIAHWGRSGSKQGRSRYEMLESGDLLVTDWILSDDGWQLFSRNTYSRESGAKPETCS